MSFFVWLSKIIAIKQTQKLGVTVLSFGAYLLTKCLNQLPLFLLGKVLVSLCILDVLLFLLFSVPIFGEFADIACTFVEEPQLFLFFLTFPLRV
jgi:hypothetical protein